MTTSLLADLGIRPLINANATLTRLGGSLMPPEVVDAMRDASHHWVDLAELQRAVGARLASMTRNEGALVSTGAAAGLTLAAAALMTGDDPSLIARLPDSGGFARNEFIVHKSHRNGYDHSIRSAGGKIVEIGSALQTHEWELTSAINPHTAGIFWFQGAMTGIGDLPFSTVVDIARDHQIPVIVDAAAQLPPVENLWRFTRAGAALAIFSGGKDLRGPQTTGLCVGNAQLIETMRLNGSPNHSVGRGLKVGKEELAGLLAAVDRYLKLDHAARSIECEAVVAHWNRELCRIPGLQAERSFPNEAGQPLPRSHVTFDASISAQSIASKLMACDPAVSVALGRNNDIYLNPMTLEHHEDEIVLNQLMLTLTKP